MNEVLQWTVLAALAFLTMGLFRYISAHSQAPPAAITYSGPPLGSTLPKRTMAELRRQVPGGDVVDGMLLAFVVESCIGCQTLLGQLSESHALQEGQHLVLVARNPTAQFHAALEESGLPLVLDDGVLWQECHVTNTPLLLKLNADGKITAKGVTHHVDTVALAA